MERRIFLAGLSSLVAYPAIADGATRSGIFSGVNRKKASGNVIVEGDLIKIQSNFVFSGAPDPKVAFGKDGVYDPKTLIAPLQSDEGASTYTIPSNINPNDYNEVHIWCEFFDVGLAVAPIK